MIKLLYSKLYGKYRIFIKKYKILLKYEILCVTNF